jgi:hypothetical protein
VAYGENEMAPKRVRQILGGIFVFVGLMGLSGAGNLQPTPEQGITDLLLIPIGLLIFFWGAWRKA